MLSPSFREAMFAVGRICRSRRPRPQRLAVGHKRRMRRALLRRRELLDSLPILSTEGDLRAAKLWQHQALHACPRRQKPRRALMFDEKY
jgi:hypothetical protein